MSHTEAKARELWCPMVRIARREVVNINFAEGEPYEPVIVGGCNTDALGRTRVPASCRCIASECAMWRWVPSDEGMRYSGIEVFRLPNGRVEERAKYEPVPPTHGFCGLAGRPELVA